MMLGNSELNLKDFRLIIAERTINSSEVERRLSKFLTIKTFEAVSAYPKSINMYVDLHGDDVLCVQGSVVVVVVILSLFSVITITIYNVNYNK